MISTELIDQIRNYDSCLIKNLEKFVKKIRKIRKNRGIILGKGACCLELELPLISSRFRFPWVLILGWLNHPSNCQSGSLVVLTFLPSSLPVVLSGTIPISSGFTCLFLPPSVDIKLIYTLWTIRVILDCADAIVPISIIPSFVLSTGLRQRVKEAC
ncbi:hypothetical protein RvY_03391 [Ramazzottius varieornatus]|uniref:Uncharacterized protein n=1 Tax=Ramazzottius varieornatus TaxID=947166 RepID=A0A1D1URN8_RAMVA|nr:hypothetical protein RvY_03391 [Ramazzottius varieornatus]